MTERGRRTGTVAAVAALLLLAAVVRLVGLERESLWFDEIESARLSDGDVAEVCHDSAASVHPPLYFLGLHLVRGAAGSSDAALRAPSVAASLVGLLLLYLLASDLAGRPAALLALALGAVSPLELYYAQEARMYAQAAALATLAASLLWRWLGLARDPGRPRLLLAYALTAVAMLYTHYLTALLLLAQGTFALAVLLRRRRWREAGLYAATAAAVATSFLPWIAYVRSLRTSFYADAQMDWMPRPDPGDALALLGREPFWGLAGGLVRWGPAATGLLAVAVLVVLVVGLRREDAAPGARGRGGLAYAGWLTVAPVGLAVAASHLYRPVLLPERFGLLVLAPLLVLLAAGCVRARPRAIGVALAAALLVAMALGTAVQARTPLKTDWRGLAREWPRDRPPARLVCFPPFIAYCVGHYLGGAPEVSDPATVLAAAPDLAGREVWVVTARDYPFDLRSADAESRRRLLALGPVETSLLASVWRLDRIRVQPPPDRADGGS